MAWPWQAVMGGLFSTPVAGAYGASKMAQNQGNAMMGNYNLANQSGLDLSNYITLDGTKPVINQGQLLSDVNDQLPRNLTQDLGASTVRGPQGTRFDPAQGNIPYDPQEQTGIFSNLRNKLSEFTTPGMALMKRMVEPNTPEEDFGRNYFNMSSSGRALGNMAENVFAGKNVATGFGKGMGAAAQKRIDRIGNTIQRLTDLDEEKHRQTILNLRNRQNLFQSQQDQYQKDLGAATGGADTTVTNVTQPGDGGQGYQPTTRAQNVARTASRVGPGGNVRAYGLAQGGRIGYQGGELVEDESMMEATPAGMMEENIEEVQGEPSREQLEGIALEIFRLPLEELSEQQLMVVYQAAMEQEPSEEEVQFAAQEGPAEGLASLV